jgi:phage terminase large subunit-like protein
MDNIKVLRKLIGEEAITFMKANEKNYDTQFNSFVNMNNKININGQEYVFGIDLSEDKDMTAYAPL